MTYWLIFIILLLQLSAASFTASSSFNCSSVVISEQTKVRMYQDEYFCEEMAMRCPIHARLAQQILAEKLKFPVMADLPFHSDYTIFYGLEFKDKIAALPALFEGAVNLFRSMSQEKFGDSLLRLVCEDLLDLLNTDSQVFQNVTEIILLDESFSLFFRHFFIFLIEKGYVTDAVRFAINLASESRCPAVCFWKITVTPTVIKAFVDNPQLFFDFYNDHITSAGLQIALTADGDIFERIISGLAGFDVHGALTIFLEEINQEFLEDPLVRERILALFACAPTGKYYYNWLRQNLAFRGLIPDNISKEFITGGAIVAALRAGNIPFFLEHYDLRNRLIPVSIDTKCPRLRAYLLENKHDPHCQRFMQAHQSIFEDVDFLLPYYESGSIEKLLTLGSSMVLNFVTPTIAVSGTIRQFSRFWIVASAAQFRHLFSYFLCNSKHDESEFACIFNYFLSYSAFLLEGREGFQNRDFLRTDRLVQILENENLCNAFMQNHLFLNGIVCYGTSALHELLANDRYYQVAVLHKPVFLRFVAHMGSPIDERFSPLELRRWLHISECDPGVLFRDSIRKFTVENRFFGRIMPFKLTMMHYMRLWFKYDRVDVLNQIGCYTNQLDNLFHDKHDATYVRSIVAGMSEATQFHLRNLLLLLWNSDFEPQQSDAEAEDSDGELEVSDEDEANEENEEDEMDEEILGN